MNKKTDLLRSKRIVATALAVAVVLIVIMVIYSKTDIIEDTETLPDSLLTAERGLTEFDVDMEKYPLMYVFEDIPYAICVPSKGLTKVEGGYAYKAGEYGLIVSEVSPSRTLQAYSSDVYSSLYAEKGQAQINELSTEEGFINGYKATYAIYDIFLQKSNKHIFQVAYLLEVDKENVLLIITMDKPDEPFEKLENGRDILVEMIKTLSLYDRQTEERSEETPADSNPDETDDVVTREAFITAEYDYEMLYLTFSYMDIKSKPQECKAFDKNGIAYEAVDEQPGSISFKIPNVKAGEDIKLLVTSGDLKGSTVEQMEYSDYMSSQSAAEEGTLHVEETETQEFHKE